jgi:hypothetical protein
MIPPLDPFALGGRQPEDDPVLALIAEEDRLRDEGVALQDRADTILFGLPEDIQRGPKILLMSRRGDVVPKPTDEVSWRPRHFDSERALLEWFESTPVEGCVIGPGGKWVLSRSRGLSDARRSELLSDWRADKARIDAALEASGEGALRRKGDGLVERANQLIDEISAMTPTTLAGAVAMLGCAAVITERDLMAFCALTVLRKIVEKGGAA